MTPSPVMLEALCSGFSPLLADPIGPLLDQYEEEALSPPSLLEENENSLSYASSLSPYQTMFSSPLSSSPDSPPPSPPTHHSILGTKAGEAQLTLPWLSTLLDSNTGADDGKDAFAGMEWMSEKIDLSDLDLDSLIGSCGSDPPSSPDDLLASLDTHMDLDLDQFDVPAEASDSDLGLLPPDVAPPPAVGEEAASAELAVKVEPASPAPPSPGCTLELGSEVDLEAEKNVAVLPADPFGTPGPLLVSLVTSVLVAEKVEPAPSPIPDSAHLPSPLSSDCDSDSGIDSGEGSPPRLPSPPPSAGSSRTKPYSKPQTPAPGPTTAKAPRLKTVSGAPKVVEKKLKKMEQNKTAATRYRQKKRVEQEKLNAECDELEKRNCELQEKAESINREIQYLKDLMEEVRKRRSKTSTPA